MMVWCIVALVLSGVCGYLHFLNYGGLRVWLCAGALVLGWWLRLAYFLIWLLERECWLRILVIC